MSVSMTSDWLILQRHYERCLLEAGVTPQGVDWPDGRGLEARFSAQLEVLRGFPVGRRPTLLDLGCGPGLLVDYMAASDRENVVTYRGIDLSELMVASARERWPDLDFTARDIVADPLPPKSVDVVVMNGVLTERRGIPRPRMVKLAEDIVRAAFLVARHGISFNAMSVHVDWQRDDLFHWGFDEIASFLKRDVTRHFAFRSDYGLYEFTAFAWVQPQLPPPCAKQDWWSR